MKRQKKGFRYPVSSWIILFMVIRVLICAELSAQQMVVNVNVRPPYSTKLDLYPEQTRVIITSPFSVSGSLSIHIKGNNGVDLITGPDYAGSTLDISANEVNQFGGNDISGYFEFQNLISRGIPIQEIIENGLPEGSYQICVRIKGPDGGFLSPEEPLGCSNFFTIRYGEPPMTINPLCGTRISNLPVQNIVFSWTPATNAPAWTQYTLKIVELSDSTQNPDAAMLTATEPAFFETTLQGRFSFLYGPAQPLLEKGNIYAWQVIAEERETEVRFSNNGRSPVCWFKWDPPGMKMVEMATTPAVTETGGFNFTTISNEDHIPISIVSGNLNYKFKGDVPETVTTQISQGGNSQGGISQSGNSQGGISQVGVSQVGVSQGGISQTGVSQVGGSQYAIENIGFGVPYNKDNISPANSRPLGNVKVSLIVTYVLKGKINNQEYNGQPVNMADIRESEKFAAQYPDHERVVATTTTASDGSFSFLFMNTNQETGLIDANANWKSGGGDFFDQMSGQVYKVFRLRVENKYYCSPDVNIKLDPWQALELGTIVSYVKSYNLSVHTKWTSSKFWHTAGGQQKDLDEVKTSLVRKTMVNGIPRDEVIYPVSGSLNTFSIYPKNLDTDYTGGDGRRTFTNLVQHDPDNTQDRYHVLCEPDKDEGLYIFKKRERPWYPIHLSDKQNFPFNSVRAESLNSGIQSPGGDTYGENITWNSQLQVKTYELTMELYPDDPRIAGKVETEQVGTKPLSNVTLMLLSNYTRSGNNNVLVRKAKTDANGYYEFNKLDVELDTTITFQEYTEVLGPDRTLFCFPTGFKGDTRHPGVMVWGQQAILNFKLEPDGLLTGYVTDENGNAVAADVRVDDLAFASTTMQFEYGGSGAGSGGAGAGGNAGAGSGGAVSGGNVGATGNAVGGGSGGAGGNAGAGTVSGTGGGIMATGAVNNYQVSGGSTVQMSYTNTSQSFMPTDVKQVFTIKAPSGNGRTITIVPRDPGYSSETYTVDVPKATSAQTTPELKQYVLHKKKKRIQFMVAEKPPGNIFITASLKPVPNAEVTLKIPGADITRTTDQRGNVLFEFENSDNSFNFEIQSPVNADLEDATYTLNDVQDRKSAYVYPPALLKKATRITGKVSLGNENVPVSLNLEGATVYIDLGNGERLETKTDKGGNYVLTKVPRQPMMLTVWASKPNSAPNINSQSKKIILQDINKLNFMLSYDNELFIENIYGFEADIKNKEKQSDGTYLINGALINLPANPNFKPEESGQTIPFTKLKIKESGSTTSSGIPIGVPAEAEFKSNLAELVLLLNESFGVVQTPSSGELITISSENNKGRIKGKAGILKSSFHYSGSYLSFQEDIPLFLTPQPGSSDASVVSLTTDDYPSMRWGLTGTGGSNIQFRLLDFDADASRATAWLEGDKIGLPTVITTGAIPGMVPSNLTVDLGELILRPDQIDPVTGSQPLKFKLEKWDFETAGWSFQKNTGGIYIPHGTIKTGLVDVPAKNIRITPNQLKIEAFEMNNLTFSGVAPLNILTQNNSFGYNPSTGSDKKAHWELRIIGTGGAPGVSISNLPGMEPGTELKFQSFSLYSNGEQQIDMGNQQQVLIFHKILKVEPIAFSGGDKYFEMSCSIDLGVPRIKPGSGIIRFSRPDQEILFTLYPFSVNFEGPGGVKFVSGITQGDQKLEASGFTAVGSIRDKEGIDLKGKLHRTINGAWVEVDPTGQKMPLGSGVTSLKDIEGRMEVLSNINDWSKFTFSGYLDGFTGMQSGLKKSFTVHGSITADNESLEVTNIPTPFGGMELTYDIQNARLTGSIDIDKQWGALHIKGASNIMVDEAGWYFLMAGELTAPGFGNMAAGMLIGDYRVMKPDVVQTLMQFAYNKNVPSAFTTGVSGFFFTGRKDVPVINIPEFEINLGVMSASLGLSAGLDGRLWMGFQGGGNEYGIGAMAFVHAWFKATSITCTKLSAEARVELGTTGIYQSNTGLFTAAGCGSFTISGSAQQCFPTPCWDGICCTGCIGGGVSKSIKLDLMFNSSGSTSLDFGFGNCSGQSSLTGN
ncbi:MAG: hypothetical protein ABR519_07785 [Bacteroidales bacterium]